MMPALSRPLTLDRMRVPFVPAEGGSSRKPLPVLAARAQNSETRRKHASGRTVWNGGHCLRIQTPEHLKIAKANMQRRPASEFGGASGATSGRYVIATPTQRLGIAP